MLPTVHASERNLGIDLLRVFSVCLVMFSHYGLTRGFILGGTHGVVIFFMVSGYCMQYSVQGRNGGRFLEVRLWRLVPTLVLCATLTSGFEWLLPEVLPQRLQTVKDYVANVLCLSNANLFCDAAHVALAGNAVDYRWVDGAYWSLLVEMRFYLLLWLLYYLLKQRRMAAMCIALLGLPAVFNLSTPVISKSQDFLLYLPFFAFGMAYRAWRDGARRAWAVMIVAFGVFLCEAGLGSQALSMELNRDNLPSYATCFLVFLVCMAIGRKGHSWPVSYLGVLSYPLYLLHQDIGLIVIALAEPHLGLVGAAALALLSALALAAIVQWAIDLWQPPVKTMVRRLFRTFVWRRV